MRLSFSAVGGASRATPFSDSRAGDGLRPLVHRRSLSDWRWHAPATRPAAVPGLDPLRRRSPDIGVSGSGPALGVEPPLGSRPPSGAPHTQGAPPFFAA